MERETLHRFFAGTTTGDEDGRIVDWVESDPANERAFLAERRLWNEMVMHLESPEIESSEIEPHLNRSAEAEKRGAEKLAAERRAKVFPRWAREAVRTAAVAVLLTGVGWWIGQKRVEFGEMSVTVPVGQQIDLTLGDGTRVTLNGQSTLCYPSVFARGERRVKLTGEGYFDVEPNNKRPFVIETPSHDIEVLGTEFNVEAYGGEHDFVTSLVDGSVKISDRAYKSRPLVLTSNQQARFSGGRMVVGTIPSHEQFQWRDGLIAFHRATMTELVAMLERYYGFEISYKPLPTESLLSGKIRVAEGVEHALWVLQQNTPFKYEKDMENMTIKIEPMK